ncbi:hypothetical protein A2954_01190 [Candidatus Roizmanbacteria bacterium RIFCSPLOWO2_01_FULL_37_12]|uniref:FAD/NAD(P)-binding domain-containing protein n=1 Tax=Candidatus Roizmanbacteria bacterium RIFCSPLOWO2_01_FULL_37_12 TaxID=1802056 RepID=A0A1F7IGF0_9BACT|nr:MAG: hypothetical protein A3D76_01660 [Candidatus Roizmanbacteria bacterium RIFCSPHIGHO2_02_FULL_37_9b]OGK42440.1 MAG: hypothetical protein A2954_01190 [Candidatus Roizmanbacteria bacterium RIFCSPLOWO2_01_FULL_37_12]
MAENKTEIEDVIIIGGGPAGLAAALYTARAGLNPLLFAGSPPGGQLMLTSDVENYPGFESILGPELIEKYRSHVKKFGVRIIDQNITEVQFSKSPFKVQTVDKTYQGKAIIIATGAKALWLGLENEQRLRGRGVSACATCDGFFFKNKVVAVVGGGDTAMEEALTLTKFATKIHLVHRRDIFRASKIMQTRVLKDPKIEVHYNSVITDVIGENRVEAIKLNSDSEIKVDGLFLAIGHKPDTEIFKGQIEVDKKGYINTSARIAIDNIKYQISPSTSSGSRVESRENIKMINQNSKINNLNKYNFNFQSATSIPGVFAAGDCVDYQYRQAGTAVGMGIAAALDVEKWLELNHK